MLIIFIFVAFISFISVLSTNTFYSSGVLFGGSIWAGGLCTLNTQLISFDFHSPFFGSEFAISYISRYLGGYFLILSLDEIQGFLGNLLETQIQMYQLLLEMAPITLPNIMVVRSLAQWLYVPWQVERHNLGLPKPMAKVIDIFACSFGNSVHCIFSLGIVHLVGGHLS